MAPSRLADPPEEGMDFAHTLMLIFGGLIGLLGVVMGIGGFVYFVLL